MIGRLHCLGLSLFLLGSQGAAEARQEEFEALPQPLAWEQLSPAVFDRQWILPEPRRVPGRDLLAEMRRLQSLRIDVRMEDGTRHRCFGDLVQAMGNVELERRGPWLRELERQAPKLFSDWSAGFAQLFLDSKLHTKAWRPSKADAKDGMLFSEAWSLKQEPSGPWKELRVEPLMEQAAALIHADLATIKAVENDYRAYASNVGADYQAIYPLLDSYRIGRDPEGRPFSALALYFKCNLPFPFSSYRTELSILNRFDDQEVLYTDIYSTSEDFYWLAGRDVFLPVSNSQGQWVAFLVVRQFGFDLDGVPDGPDNRREATRSSLGNLKRNAERRYREREDSYGDARNSPGELHRVRVLGTKRR